MANVEEIALKIKVQSEKFESGMKKATRSAKKFGDQAKKSAKKSESAFKSGFNNIVSAAKSSGFLALMSGGALAAFAKDSINSNRELQVWSKTLGVGTEKLKSFQVALESIGFGGEKATDILKDVNDKLGEFIALGTGQAKDLVDRLGLSKADFAKNDPIGNLKQIVARMDQLKISGKERVFLLEALANDASKLEPLLKNNASELERLQKAAKESGRVLTGKQQANITELGESVKQAWDNFKGLAQIGLAKIAPLFTMLTNLIGKLGEAFIGLSNKLGDALSKMRGYLAQLGSGIANVIGDARDVREARARSQTSGTGNFGFQTASLRGQAPTQGELMMGGVLNTLIDMFTQPADKIEQASTKMFDSSSILKDTTADLGNKLMGFARESETMLGKMIQQQGSGEVQRILGGGLKPQAKTAEFDKLAQTIFREAQKTDRDNTAIAGMLDRLRQMEAVSRNINPQQSTAGMQKVIKELATFIKARGDGADKARAEIKIDLSPSKDFMAKIEKVAEEKVKVMFGGSPATIGS